MIDGSVIGTLAFLALSMTTAGYICFYPFRPFQKASTPYIIFTYLLIYAIEIAYVFTYEGEFHYEAEAGGMTAPYLALILNGFIAAVPALAFSGGSLSQIAFMWLVCCNFQYIVFGIGQYVAQKFSTQTHNYIIGAAVSVCASALLIFPVLIMLRKLYRTYSVQHRIWKFFWLIPGSMAAYSITCFDPMLINEVITTPYFLFSRIILGIGLTVSCYALYITLKSERDRSIAQGELEAIERQLILQRSQYRLLAGYINSAKEQRHDKHHQLIVIRALAESGQTEKLQSYIAELMEEVDETARIAYCENVLVNVVASHYLGIALAEGIQVDAKMDIPEGITQIRDGDLCIIIGNLLENALEACRYVSDSPFIKVLARLTGRNLAILVENSFDGKVESQQGKYISRKTPEEMREGIGLTSVKNLCQKYDGMFETEHSESVWRASALLLLDGKQAKKGSAVAV